jgi:hypothetical protein
MYFEALSQWPVIAKELGVGSQNRKDIQQSFIGLYKQYVTYWCNKLMC